MKKLLLFLSIGLLTQPIFSQVKLWNKSLKVERTKGFFTELKIESPKNENNSIISTSLIGSLLPFAISYGNYAIKKATKRNERDYKSESGSLNKLVLKSEDINNKDLTFSVNQFFYKKADTTKNLASKYSFDIKRIGQAINIRLSKVDETFSPVKVKKGYDLIITNFDITVKALVEEQLDATIKKQRIIDLSTNTIYLVKPSFQLSTNEIINEGNYLIPKYSERGNQITVKGYQISCKVNHVNPYGLTTSDLNDFLEKNSSLNEELLNSILLKQ